MYLILCMVVGQARSDVVLLCCFVCLSITVFDKLCFCFFFFKRKTAYEILYGLVGSGMCIRDRVIGGNTQIDKDVKMESIIDFWMYVPRAFQVGMFSPMPQFWSGEGSSPAMTMARKILGAATLFFYFCLVGLFLGAYRFWRSPAFWAIAVVCLSGILLYSFTHPNVGTLIRYRYGFYMLLVAFGAATIPDGLLSRVKHK